MTKRKPRSRAKPRTAQKSGNGRNWLLAGALLAAGWFAYDANRPFVAERMAAVRSSLMPSHEAEAPAVEARAANTTTQPARPPRQIAAAAASQKPRPQLQALASPAREAADPALPTRRPPAAVAAPAPDAAKGAVATRAAAPTPATGQQKIARQTPLYREAARTAPVWVVLEPGHTVRVTGRKGEFRRVEAGIFTGWVEVAALGAAAPASAAPALRSASRAPTTALAITPAPMRALATGFASTAPAPPTRPAPMPRGSIPERSN